MDVILIGSGGCMREIVWQMLNSGDRYHILGYTSDKTEEGIFVEGYEIPCLGNDDYFLKRSKLIKKQTVNVVITIGEPNLRYRIADKLRKISSIHFPVIVLGDAQVCSDARLGIGSIISAGCRISTNVTLGEFVFCNIGSTICHDGVLEDYVTVSPGVNLAGQVHVGQKTSIGIGSTIIQGINIGEDVILGAGSVVIKDIPPCCTAVGVPAKIIK